MYNIINYNPYRATLMRRMVDSLTLPLTLSGKVDHVPCSQVTPLISSDHRLGGAYKPLMDRPTSSTSFEHCLTEHYKCIWSCTYVVYVVPFIQMYLVTTGSFEERHEFHHAKKRMASSQDSACTSKELKLDEDSS